MTIVDLPPPPPGRPGRPHTAADLLALQRLMIQALLQPLSPADTLAANFRDGRPMEEIAASFIKPNERLSAKERLQIYARCYWFRVIDSVYDDSPGLRALLGEKRFAALVRAYLARHPSRSFTLRNLCSRLPQFVREEPRWTAPDTALAVAIARLEWAQTVAFDGEARPTLSADEIQRTPPAALRIALQPYLSLLALPWPVDDLVTAARQRLARRAESSRTFGQGSRGGGPCRVARPRRRRTHVVVHRYQLKLYCKRVPPAAFRLLTRLAAGDPLAEAVAAAGHRVTPGRLRAWFATGMELGWFCAAK